MLRHKQSEKDIFASSGWLRDSHRRPSMINDRCDYVESCVNRVFGGNALAQQEILEVGCGGGLLCQELAERGALMVGIDPSPAALVVARERIQKRGLGQNVNYRQGYAESLPYAGGSFSAIICLGVLEHVDDPRAALAEIARVLAPGGIFIFDTINRTWMARAALIWLGEHLPRAGLPPGLHSYHKFIKPAELRLLINDQGLQVRELVGYMPRSLANGRFKWGPGWFTGILNIGYAIKR